MKNHAYSVDHLHMVLAQKAHTANTNMIMVLTNVFIAVQLQQVLVQKVRMGNMRNKISKRRFIQTNVRSLKVGI